MNVKIDCSGHSWVGGIENTTTDIVAIAGQDGQQSQSEKKLMVKSRNADISPRNVIMSTNHGINTDIGKMMMISIISINLLSAYFCNTGQLFGECISVEMIFFYFLLISTLDWVGAMIEFAAQVEALSPCAAPSTRPARPRLCKPSSPVVCIGVSRLSSSLDCVPLSPFPPFLIVLDIFKVFFRP